MLPTSINAIEAYSGANGILKCGSRSVGEPHIYGRRSRRRICCCPRVAGVHGLQCGVLWSCWDRAAKICNNLLLAISMIGTAEAMNLGIRLGLDPKLLAKILNMSSGRCWSSDTYNPVPGVMDGVPSANNYQGGFGTTLMAKDLGLAQDSATSTKSPILLGSQAHQIYRMMCAKGYSKKDFSSVFQFLREEETF
uniref:3-hydroxyisobutyrate dehydrogenase, mitochondrial n=1 Tax=Capra hircus TaxID=9925 RepID=A0A452E7M5_CAPHI